MTDGRKEKAHGGKRKGAGRPRKWGLLFVIKVGQACEKLHREAVSLSVNRQKADLTSQQTELEYLWGLVNKIPTNNRSAFLDDEAFDIHKEDIDAELEMLASTDGPAIPRIFQLRAKASRGTRKNILSQVAKHFGLSTKQVDNLWQAYRRFERE